MASKPRFCIYFQSTKTPPDRAGMKREEKTINQILEKLEKVKIPDVLKEIIVVDDGSTDSSKFKVRRAKLNNIKLISHEKNLGKGTAVRTGIKNSTGDYILIQDADLEYARRDKSLPLALFLDRDKRIDDRGLKIGLTIATSGSQFKHPVILGDRGGYQILDLNSSTSAELSTEGWVFVNPSQIYHSTQEWYVGKNL